MNPGTIGEDIVFDHEDRKRALLNKAGKVARL